MSLRRSARNWSDSGNQRYIGTSNKSGTRPPTYHTERHPYCGISHAARKPPSAAPTVKPFVTIIIVAIRIRFGLNSPINAVAFGRIAPRPRPAKKRTTKSSLNDVARPDASVSAEKATVAPSSTRRRPILSPTIPNTIEPMKRPKSPDMKMGVSASLEIFQSVINAGAT